MTDLATSKRSLLVSARLSQLNARKQRIERWAFTRESPAAQSSVSAATALLGSAAARKRFESTVLQTNRMLNVQLLQLSLERQQTIERNAFNQNVFINRQASKYKHDEAMLDMLDYARQCAKYADAHKSRENSASSREQSIRTTRTTTKRSHSRALSPVRSPPTKRSISANVSLPTAAPVDAPPANGNAAESPSCDLRDVVAPAITVQLYDVVPPAADEGDPKRHVQFQENAPPSGETVPNAEVKETPAFVTRASTSLPKHRSVAKSAPLVRAKSSLITATNGQRKQSPTANRPSIRKTVTKATLRDFDRHPEKYLDSGNLYLPLLRRSAFENDPKENPHSHKAAHPSAEVDVVFDDARSFLSDDNDTGKPVIPSQSSYPFVREHRGSKKRLATGAAPNTPSANIARVHERECARMNTLIQSDLIEKVLEPMATVKVEGGNVHQGAEQPSLKPARARQLADILRSIDSLTCSDAAEKRTRKDVDPAKNRAKLGILIF